MNDTITWIKASASNSQGNCAEMAPWVKASASSDTGSCVEQQQTRLGVKVRDSKDPDGPQLHFTTAEFAAWLDGAKKGEFDHLV
jgi:hypothetical protein